MTPSLTDRPALTRNRLRAAHNPVLFLHEHAADEIKDRLELVNKSFRNVAIISGHTEFWQGVFPDATCAADEDVLDLKENTHDLVIHAMCLHWANDPVGQMVQARRAMVPDGLFIAVFFGGRTLYELRASLAQAEADLFGGLSPRVAPMGEIRDLGALLQRAGLTLPVADCVTLNTSYQTPWHLMREVRAMGEGNALTDRQKRFTTRPLFTRACDIYQNAFADDDGRVPATFELICLTGWSPDSSQPKPLRPGSATARLADQLGTKEIPLKD